MNMIRLHFMHGSQREVYVDADKIIGIYETWSAAGTFMWTTVNIQGLNDDGLGYYKIKETLEEILDLIDGPYPNHY